MDLNTRHRPVSRHEQMFLTQEKQALIIKGKIQFNEKTLLRKMNKQTTDWGTH